MITFSVDASKAIAELDRLSKGPVDTVHIFEGILMSSFAQVQERTHVMTGKLRAGGHPESSFDGDTWSGTIAFPRYPGIFELARGNKPSHNHPEGGHYFFAPAYRTPGAYEKAIEEFLRGYSA